MDRLWSKVWKMGVWKPNITKNMYLTIKKYTITDSILYLFNSYTN